MKSLHGLKEAPKQWHEKFDNAIISNGFKINECNKCVYVKHRDKWYVLICLYIDDMFIIGSNHEMIMSTKKLLNKLFDMKDIGVADVILGMKISKTSKGYSLLQTHYIKKNTW